MKAGDLHWIDPAERMRAGQRRRFRVRIRYRQPLQGAELVVCDEGGYLLSTSPSGVSRPTSSPSGTTGRRWLVRG